MKKLLFGLFLLCSLSFVSCEKLTVEELLYCSEERDNKLRSANQLYLDGITSDKEYQNALDKIERDYQDCINEYNGN